MTEMTDSEAQRPAVLRAVFWYLLVVLVVTIPFWVLGSITQIHGLPFNMQLNVLLIFALPVLALLFIAQIHGRAILPTVLRACLPKRTGLVAVSVAWLTMPLAGLLVSGALLLRGQSIAVAVPFATLPLYFIGYYIAAAFEEIGWTWLVTPPLGERFGVLRAGVLIGCCWALVHLWPWFVVNGLAFTIGMALLSIINRVIMTWLFLWAGRNLWLNLVYHAMINTTLTLFQPGTPAANPLAYCVVILVLVGGAFVVRNMLAVSARHVHDNRSA